MSPTALSPAPWALEASKLPLGFAQVREDAEVDRWVLRAIGRPCRVLMTASGGCTAAALAVEPQVERLEFLDLNPAQVALTRLKLRFLYKTPQERLELLGHAPMPGRLKALRQELDPLGLDSSILGPSGLLEKAGPDHAGRYEALFAALRSSGDPASVFALENLEALFPKAAAAARVQEFSAHFARRLATREDNPYLAQMLKGRFTGAATPWLEAAVPSRLPDLSWSVGSMRERLESMNGEADFIHLSNLLDWSGEDEAAAVLSAALKALRPGGWVIVRQLNSPHDIPALGPGFHWPKAASLSLHALERSRLYRRLWVGLAS